jgi:membrane protease YdiL (CAAX protease family)
MSPDELALPPETPSPVEAPTQLPAQRGIAPVWHTVVLILAIIGFSFWGSRHADSDSLNPLAPVHRSLAHSPHNAHSNPSDGEDPLRLLRYALTGALELGVVAWVAFGLRLRKVPLRSLLGQWPRGLNDITKEAGIAALFWIASMVVLGAASLTWFVVQTQIEKHQEKIQQHNQPGKPSQPKSSEKKQVETVRQLMEIAPANGLEIAAWGALCLIVGFSEELAFRGYLQSQGIALLHRIPIAIILTSLVFGAAHGYQGIRGMCLIGLYGALFSGIALLRRNLFPGMLAHSWHDFATGLLLALIRSAHLLDRLTAAS